MVSMDWFTNNWWNNLLRKVIFIFVKELKQMDNRVKKRVWEWNISQRSFEILSELVLNNKDTTDFILDWEYYIINFYDEGVFSYDTFTGIWHEYASFIEIVKLILSGLLVY